MAIENIDGTITGTGVYNTKVPGLSENADIQTAFRLYHYGSTAVPANRDAVTSGPGSIAGTFKAVENRVTALETQGIGSTFNTTPPDTTNLPDGFIWVDEDTVAPILGAITTVPSVAKYQSLAPTGTISDGSLWVDKDSITKDLSIYDVDSSQWLLVNTGATARYQAGQPSADLKIGSLWVDSASATVDLYVYNGTAWKKIGGPA